MIKITVIMLSFVLIGVQAFSDVNDMLLIHSNETSSSSSFVDSSNTGHTITANGNASHQTSQAKFGSSSIAFDGNGDYLTVANSSDFIFGNGNFTIDFWVRLSSISSEMGLLGHGSSSSNRWSLLFDPNGTQTDQLKFSVKINGTGYSNFVYCSPAVNTWYHVAVVRSGNSILFFINGTLQGTSSFSQTLPSPSSSLLIGSYYNSSFSVSSSSLNGYMDEVRISNIARWTASFTPPANPYDHLETPVLATPVPGDSSVQLSWTSDSNASTHKVKYGTETGVYTQEQNVSGNSATINGLINQTAYYFAMTSYNSSFETPLSNEVSAVPAIPPAPVLNTATAGPYQVNLEWTGLENVTGYHVKYGETSGNYPTVLDAGANTTFTVPGLENNTTYYFVVTGYDGSTESPVSNELSAIPHIPALWSANGNHAYYSLGNVGIGIQNPASALAVNGTITAKKVEVTSQGWADFVFSPSYSLRSFESLNTFISENGHLPDIPRATDIEQKGIDLAQMMKLQMQKIEELTLYVIKLNEENQKLSEEIEKLKNLALSK